MEVLTVEEIVQLIEVSRTTAPDMTNLYTLLSLTGLRIGEALGLRWVDINFVNSTIHVRQQLLKDGVNPEFAELKTRSSNRVLDMGESAMSALLEEKRTQGTYKAEDQHYHDYDLVFCQPNGRPLPHKPIYKQLHDCFKAGSMSLGTLIFRCSLTMELR